MSPTVESAGLAAGFAAGCASASAHRTASAMAARAVRVFILQPPVSPLSTLRGAPETLGHYIIRALQTQRRLAAPSAELARNIVVERDTHQDDEQGDANLLSHSLGPLRQTAALQPLHQLEDDLSAIQDRNRQQVEEPQRERNEHQEAEERRHPRLGGFAGELGDGQRAA